METSPGFLTPEGAEKIKQELYSLRHIKRKEVAARIEKAKDMGDLSENAEYTSAKEEQGFIEGKIAELKNLLRGSVVIEKKEGLNIVLVGSKVKAIFDSETKEYLIVGAHESNPTQGKISNESPLGQSLVGKKIGDEFEIQLPLKNVKCKILEIE